MNIFFLSENPRQAAVWLVDRHIVKMILESAQILCTAHRVCDGHEVIEQKESGRKVKRYLLKDKVLDENLYSATHINHPSTVWARESKANYSWLYEHTGEMLNEYSRRYNKIHKVESDGLYGLLKDPPKNILKTHLTPFAIAMADEYKISCDPIECYRYYYKYGKERMHSWKNIESKPEWL